MRAAVAAVSRFVPALLVVAAFSGCTEETLTGVDPTTAPGDVSQTIELDLSAVDLPSWRDTTFTGFALPSTSGILIVSESPELRARTLARFPTIPDSAFVDPNRLPIERFETGRLRVVIDTAASSVGPAGVDLTLYSLARGFEEREASWSVATADEPWATPGGDFAEVLGTLSLDSLSADTVFIPLAVDTDSLLTAWRADEGEPGIALVAETPDASLTLRQIALSFDVKPAGVDTLIETLRSPTPTSFIFDPETPAPAGPLRIGGLPAARAYVTFVLPERLDDVALRGARINRAVLLLDVDAPPDAPFAATDTSFASGFSLLADPFEFGPKVPVGINFGSSVALAPDELAEGGQIELNVTTVIQAWAAANPDSMPDVSIAVRLLPEGGGLSFWEFADASQATRAPRLRMLVTPPTPFDLP